MENQLADGEYKVGGIRRDSQVTDLFSLFDFISVQEHSGMIVDRDDPPLIRGHAFDRDQKATLMEQRFAGTLCLKG